MYYCGGICSSHVFLYFQNVSDMPRRSYCFARDSFAVITISKEKSFFTGRKSRKTVAEKKTNQVKRNLNPNYNFHMSTDIDVEDVKVK